MNHFEELKRLKFIKKQEKDKYIELIESRNLYPQQDLSKEVVGGGKEKNPMETKFLNIILKETEQYKKYEKAVFDYEDHKDKISKIIGDISHIDHRYAVILHERFINGKTQEKTACIVGFSVQHLKRLEKRAIEHFNSKVLELC